MSDINFSQGFLNNAFALGCCYKLHFTLTGMDNFFEEIKHCLIVLGSMTKNSCLSTILYSSFSFISFQNYIGTRYMTFFMHVWLLTTFPSDFNRAKDSECMIVPIKIHNPFFKFGNDLKNIFCKTVNNHWTLIKLVLIFKDMFVWGGGAKK